MTNPNLASIIGSPVIRRIVYVAYGSAVLVAGAIQAAYAIDGAAQPDWLMRTFAVLTYLAVPVAGLAVANVPSKDAGTIGTATVNVYSSPVLDEAEVARAASDAIKRFDH